jgi:hypothetical protein
MIFGDEHRMAKLYLDHMRYGARYRFEKLKALEDERISVMASRRHINTKLEWLRKAKELVAAL